MIKDLIEKLGISRRKLAEFLQTDQSHLSRYENHTRNMPFAAIPAIAQLVATLHTAPPMVPPGPTEAEKKLALEKADWCRVQLIPLEKKLAAMQQAYQQATTMLYVLDVYETENKEVTARMQSWVAGQRYAANKKGAENGWQPQQELARKIMLLEADARFWEDAISE